MESTNLCLYEKGNQKISACDDKNISMKSDSFQVDMESFFHSPLTNKELTFNSRFNLQRSSSKKGSPIGEDKMSDPSNVNERDVISLQEKLTPAIPVITEPQIQHQISINTRAVGTPKKNKLVGKRSRSFKQTATIINPRRIMLLFATLSSMGTILLIYFTLSMPKHNGDENFVD